MPKSAPSAKKRVLMVIPSVLKRGIEGEIASDRHPRMDYFELASTLEERGCDVALVDYTSLNGPDIGFKDVRLALLAFLKRSQFDVIFANSESIALPLAIMLRNTSPEDRPRIVTIGHRISTPKKQAFFARFKVQNVIDCIFLYASSQQKFAEEILGLTSNQAPLIAFHADSKFFRPIDEISQEVRSRQQVCAAGLEWRDYPTLLEVARRMPGVDFHIAAASPWSKHKNETAGKELPPNVTVKRHDYYSLRNLYLTSDVTAVPLYETDFQAGITTILEAMACGRTVITSATTGQTDAVVDDVNGYYVPSGSVDVLEAKIAAALGSESDRRRIGASARSWIEQNATLEIWASKIADRICA